MQIDWRLVYVLEYLGPIIIISIFFFRLGWDEATFTQQIAYIMAVSHFVKRVLESIFVHVFSRPTMPIKNLLINCFYYWIIFGLNVGYFVFSEKLNDSIYIPKFFRYPFILFFISAELKNFKCHLILRNLRSKDKECRGIPHGEGFELVSAANYFWEIMAWISFTIFVTHLSALVFTICGFIILRKWSITKHKEYLKTFGDKYPKWRKAFIPYFI